MLRSGIVRGGSGLRLGIVRDPHLEVAGTSSPSVLGFPSVPAEYERDEYVMRYRHALQRCVREDVDGVVLLGDLSRSGDDETLRAGVRLAARTGRTVWAVPGNHDLGERVDALARAVRWMGAENVRLATPAGEAAERGLRIAGLSVTSQNWGYTARSDGGPDVSGWGDDLVVLLTHYPIISLVEKVPEGSIQHGDDLENLEQVARPLLERSAPTVVVNGHLHLRDARAERKVLQVSCASLMEAPVEITLLHFEFEEDRITVRIQRVPVVSSSESRSPIPSPPRQEWVFEAGAWCCAESADS
jgi:predicted phosphodiesterase